MQQETGEFTSFVREHTSNLLRTAYLLTGSAAGAEELVQDTLVRLFPKWDKVQAADVPIAYVRRSVANAYVNQRRRSVNREIALEFLPEFHDPYDANAQLADRAELVQLLGELSERQRTALVLRYFHDLPDEAIADALQCRVGTVRSLISRGLTTMRGRSASADPGSTNPVSADPVRPAPRREQ